MNEKLMNIKNKMTSAWTARSKKQQWTIIGVVIGIILFSIIASMTIFKTNMEPLYSNMTPSETGVIKENLDARGIPSEIADSGQTILVPKEQVDTLKVELAAEGIPESGSIDYSFFSQNAGIGMTDNEFNVLKLESMQTELANLMKGIEGVSDANVMISLPEKGIFVNQGEEEASASIVLDTKAGYQFEQEQIKALHHLVSKSIPNLPAENIVIMNQHFEYFDLESEEKLTAGAAIADQLSLKKEIERDLQRQVQSMLGTIMGREKVVASVTADIDFSQEKSEENLVTPVDEENMEGIAVSAQRLTETFSGEGAGEGGAPEAEDPSDSLSGSYQEGMNGNGDYEKVEETINNEVNRIHKEIVESPYKIRDLGIQVMVEPPDAESPESLPQESIDDINQILTTIVRTTIDKETLEEELTEEDLMNKVSVSVHEFNGKNEFTGSSSETAIPLWGYIVAAVLVLALIILLILYLRARRRNTREEELLYEEEQPVEAEDVYAEQETEGTLKRKQLEKLAKEKPDEFAKLLRTWLTQD